MAFWQTLLSGFNRNSTVFTPHVTTVGPEEFAAALDPSRVTAAQMWETQPHFRTVVTFVARNIAQLGVHTFERVDNKDRQRDRASTLAQVIEDVDGNMTTFEMVFALVGDLLLYDRAYWLVVRDVNLPAGWSIRRLPPTWVEPVIGNLWEVDHYRVYMRKNGAVEKIPPGKILAFPGYHPGRMIGSSPTVDALRETLQEQVESARYRGQVWKRGGRVSSVIERPSTAPQWTNEQADRFREDWYAKYTGRGSKAGGTPILEDGMQLRRIDFNAQEQQFVEAAKLSLQTVASAFHVNPTMIGQNEGATYSNVREHRKMLYGDTLGPLVAQIESRINRFLVTMLGEDRRRLYVEFNIDEKLQGNFEEQSAALQTSTGAPWMTRNEARAIRNLPAVDGGDLLVTPLNVLVGGQASPNDSGSQNRVTGENNDRRSGTPLVKAEAPATYEDQARRVFSNFFARQGRSVRSRLGQKDADWWDHERWDRELSDDLYRLAVTVSQQVASDTLASIDVEPDRYDTDRTLAFLRKMSERIAGQVNLTTFAQVEAALDQDEPAAEVAHVFDVAESSRSEQSAMAAVTAVAGFATIEAAQQTRGSRARKRWVVNSGNPRASHAAMHGEEVGLDESFSNGMPWPGSLDGSADETAGCQCSLVIITN